MQLEQLLKTMLNVIPVWAFCTVYNNNNNHISLFQQRGIISYSLCQHPAESVLHGGQERGQATETATSIIQIYCRLQNTVQVVSGWEIQHVTPTMRSKKKHLVT